MDRWNNRKTEDLIKAIMALKTKGEAKRFLRDLMTEREIMEYGNRWKAARMLNDKITYARIEKETGLSSRTIARISKWLNGGMGGYRGVLKKLNHHHNLNLSGRRLR